jgi:hypothetical protein
MGAPDREWEITVLETVLAEGDSLNLDRLLVILGVDEFHRETLLDVVMAGRWRGKEKPFHWTKQAVLGKIERLDQARPHWREVSMEIGVVDFFHFVSDSSIFRKSKYRSGSFDSDWLSRSSKVWTTGGDKQREDDDRLNDPGPMVLKLPEYLQISIYPDGAVDPVKLPDWEAIATLSGFDEWETEALKWMTFGDGEAKAMKFYDAPEEKRSIRAAFHRVQRTGFARIRAALKIS